MASWMPFCRGRGVCSTVAEPLPVFTPYVPAVPASTGQCCGCCCVAEVPSTGRAVHHLVIGHSQVAATGMPFAGVKHVRPAYRPP